MLEMYGLMELREQIMHTLFYATLIPTPRQRKLLQYLSPAVSMASLRPSASSKYSLMHCPSLSFRIIQCPSLDYVPVLERELDQRGLSFTLH
jgi:hypothetical protein